MDLRSTSHRSERGAVLLLVCLTSTALLAFTALAVDIARRNDRRAAAQHALDTAVLAAGAHLATHDGDVAGATALAQEIVRENLALPASAWVGCRDDAHLPLVTTTGSCISFRRTETTPTPGGPIVVQNDVRVRLPPLRVPTVVGRALGMDGIDVVATAGSNGDRQPDRSDACAAYNDLEVAFSATAWAVCEGVRPGFDRAAWQARACASTQVTFTFRGRSITWAYADTNRFVWHWHICRAYRTPAERDAWFSTFCRSTAEVAASRTYWDECVRRGFPLGDFDRFTATSVAVTTTTVARGGAVPTTLDLSG